MIVAAAAPSNEPPRFGLYVQAESFLRKMIRPTKWKLRLSRDNPKDLTLFRNWQLTSNDPLDVTGPVDYE